MLAALFVLEMFTINKKAIVKLKIYDVTDWTANNNNTHITQQAMKFGKLIKYRKQEIFFVGNIFLQKSCGK